MPSAVAFWQDSANIHGVHFLFRTCDGRIMKERGRILQSFLSAADASEIIFVRGATEGINLVAQTCTH